MSKAPEIYTRIFGKPALSKEQIYARNFVQMQRRLATSHPVAIEAIEDALRDLNEPKKKAA